LSSTLPSKNRPRLPLRLAFFVVTGAVTASPLVLRAQVSLGTVVDLAQRNSTSVRAALADVQRSQAVLSGAKDVLIPSLLATTGIPAFPEVGYTGSPPTLWGATVQSLVYGVTQRNYIKSAQSGVEGANFAVKDAREQVALDASLAYIELDTVNRELDAARQQEGYAAHLVDIEQQRAEAGVDPLSQLLEAKLTAANIKVARLHLESRAAAQAKQLAVLTGLPVGSIAPDHSSIPEIPQFRGDTPRRTLPGIEAAHSQANAKLALARGDRDLNYYPQLNFFVQYNRNTTLLNNVNSFFAKPLPTNNFFSGFNIQIPVFDMVHRDKANESAAEALRAKIEAEQAERQNEVQIASLTANLKELDALAEVASLKQQIAQEQVKTVLTELEVGNGGVGVPGTPAQPSPKTEQQTRIDERQKYADSLEAGLELAKARLGLIRALGHMQDWLDELHK
jgi:outer membrane protein TolC